MRGANIIASLAIALWFGWSLIGRDLIGGVVGQQTSGYPNTQQIDAYIVWPLCVTIALLTLAWVCNCFRRWEVALALLSAASIAALVPYLAFSGGGV